MIQIKGDAKFPITLDSTTWIFDDRKVKIEDIENDILEGTKPTKSEDNREWDRAILEGQTNPSTLNPGTKYRKCAVLEDPFAIDMTPFLKNAGPLESATTIKLPNDTSSIKIPLELLPYLSFQFARDGKRLYDDNSVDSFAYNPEENAYSYNSKHVTRIEVT